MGLNYRKVALKELTPKGQWQYADMFHSILEGKTTLVIQSSEWKEEIESIYIQYGGAPTFQILELGKDENHDGHQEDNWIYHSIPNQDWDSIFTVKKLFLIDRNMELRYAYRGEHEDKKKVVEHISMVLPREKDPEVILLKRNHD